MKSVTGRIVEVHQPRGGYVNLSEFEMTSFDDGIELSLEENIHATLVGLVVDYLTRFTMGSLAIEAFEISLKGAEIAEKHGRKNAINQAYVLLKGIKGLGNKSIINACKLVTFDIWTRRPRMARHARTWERVNPDKATVINIRTMVNRNVAFLEKVGPIVKNGFTFEPQVLCDAILENNENKQDKEHQKYLNMISKGKGSYGGYTSVVSSGDGDLLTKDTLWEIKCSKRKPTSKHTLQLLMYWIMGNHSGQDIYKPITKLGIFNPRLNIAWTIETSSVKRRIIKTIEKEVICY